MKTKTKQIIKTKSELLLAEKLEFRGKYVESLLNVAAKHLGLEGEDKLKTAQCYLREIARRHAERVKNKWGLSVRIYDKLREKAKRILRSFSTGYSMGEIKRLYIDTVVDGNPVSKVFVHVSNTREYSRSSRWSAKHGELSVTMSLKSLRQVENIEGVWTIRHAGNKATWLEQSGDNRSHSIKWVAGYIVGTSHGKTLQECQALEAEKTSRGEIGEAKFSHRFVGLLDRVTAGACEAGVLAFCERHNLDPNMGYRIDFLLSLGDRIAETYLHKLSRKLNRENSDKNTNNPN